MLSKYFNLENLNAESKQMMTKNTACKKSKKKSNLNETPIKRDDKSVLNNNKNLTNWIWRTKNKLNLYQERGKTMLIEIERSGDLIKSIYDQETRTYLAFWQSMRETFERENILRRNAATLKIRGRVS